MRERTVKQSEGHDTTKRAGAVTAKKKPLAIDGAMLLKKARQYATSILFRRNIPCSKDDLDDIIQDAIEMTLRDYNPDHSTKTSPKPGLLALLRYRVLRAIATFVGQDMREIPTADIEALLEAVASGPPSQP